MKVSRAARPANFVLYWPFLDVLSLHWTFPAPGLQHLSSLRRRDRDTWQRVTCSWTQAMQFSHEKLDVYKVSISAFKCAAILDACRPLRSLKSRKFKLGKERSLGWYPCFPSFVDDPGSVVHVTRGHDHVHGYENDLTCLHAGSVFFGSTGH